MMAIFNPLSANPTEWLKTPKQFVRKLPTNCLSVLDHFVGLALKGLNHGFSEFHDFSGLVGFIKFPFLFCFASIHSSI